MGLIEQVAGLAGNAYQLPVTLIVTAVVLYISYIVVSDIRQWWKLRHIPGPFLASFTRIPAVKCAWNGVMSSDYHDQQKKYGVFCSRKPNESEKNREN